MNFGKKDVLTLEQVRQHAPSVFADRLWEGVSGTFAGEMTMATLE